MVSGKEHRPRRDRESVASRSRGVFVTRDLSRPRLKRSFLQGLSLASRVRAVVAHLPLHLLSSSTRDLIVCTSKGYTVMDAQDAKQQDAMRKLEEYIEKSVPSPRSFGMLGTHAKTSLQNPLL